MTAPEQAGPPSSPPPGADGGAGHVAGAAKADVEHAGHVAEANTAPAVVRARRRVLAVLTAAQVVGGVGVGSAAAVAGIIARDLTGSQAWAGTATTMVTLGAAALALPLAGTAARRGRRVGLSLGWFLAALGGVAAVAGAQSAVFPVFLAGMALFGAGTATGLQSRHSATDLATDRTRSRDLALVVWGTTVGSVAGPNLTGPGAAVAALLGLDPLVGPLVFSTASFAAAGAVVAVLLRPDPLLLAREAAHAAAPPAEAAGTPGGRGRRHGSLAASLRAIAAEPRALLAVTAIVASHTAMVAIMTMTPVHMEGGGAELSLIGLTISLHIAGMYALSPLVGWLSDRWGRVPVLLAGQALTLGAALLAGTAGASSAQVAAGLVLLGLGWSFGLVASSALLAESLAPERRPRAQGTADLLMHVFGAAGSALSGVTTVALGFGSLNAFAAALTLPVLVLALRARRRR
ncbi:MFS transporter [Streptomonospora litoralis]|uniref:Multidrug efflux system protein MdtL n=1 Tax=Streptomonospora litoralis TaxID=2498135 RepID=A0A4P6Q6G7_9ACTN|nr:MFS transporter [Streptomonospora litoralis]QBI54639.1 multidrug efflux system protein MdtL [Streptomonospora litoralis]